MIILIAGSSHTGKTWLAQQLMEKYSYPYLSVDHLKMGLIRCGYCPLPPESDDARLTDYLWPVIMGMIRTNIENRQHLIIEGCYIPFDYRRYFDPPYLQHIKYACLVFSKEYIEKHFDLILKHADVIEKRQDTSGYLTKELLLEENRSNLEKCREYGCEYILIGGKYDTESYIRDMELIINLNN